MSVKLICSGGLGNQLFQYACARALSLRNNTNLIIDTRFYLDTFCRTSMGFCLDCFCIQADVVRYDNPFAGAHSPFRRLVRHFTEPKRRKYVEAGTGFDPGVLRLPGDVVLVGYFQSAQYFVEFSEIIIGELQLREPFQISYSSLVEGATSIHVRRGDYLTTPGFELQNTLAYYVNAILQVRKCCGDVPFVVFSDDVAWCREQEIFRDFVFAEELVGDRNLDQLALMSSCQNNIIANSSFSWWGAWLNRSEGKIVVAPKTLVSRGRFKGIMHCAG